MNFRTIAACLLFIELILESGMQLDSGIAPGLSFKNLMIYGLFLFAILQKNSGSRHLSVRPVKKIVILFVAITLYAFAVIMSQHLSGSFNEQELIAWKNQLLDCMLCFMVFYYLSSGKKELAFMLPALVAIIGVASFATLLDALSSSINIFGFDETSFRTRGAFGESNQTAAILSLFLPLVVALGLTKSRWRMMYWGIAITILAAMATTVSRGGILAASIGCLMLLWGIRKKLSISSKLLIAVSLPMFAVTTWLILPESYQGLIIERFSIAGGESENLDQLSSGRTLLWGPAYSLWLESPIFGRGWNSFQSAAGVASHNTYIEYLVSVGVLGFIIIMALWYRLFAFIAGSRAYCQNQTQFIVVTGMAAGTASILIALFFVNLYRPWFFVWSFLGLAMAYCNQIRLDSMRSMDISKTC